MTPETKFANKVCKAFEKAGWTTINLEALGDGVPDRLIAKYGYTFFLEFKMPGGDLTKHQKIWKKKNNNNIRYYIITKNKVEDEKYLLDYFNRKVTSYMIEIIDLKLEASNDFS